MKTRSTPGEGNRGASATGLIPRVASVIAVLVGCLVLIGWTFQLDSLKRVIPGAVGMNPVTAICFILLGVSLWLLRKEDAGGRWRWAARTLAIVVALVGVIKLTQIMAGWEYGIDQLIFPEKVERETAVIGIPNRIAPNTALNLLLLGAAAPLLDWRTRRGRWPAQYFILVSIVASMLAIVGYVYGVTHFVGVFTYVPMALHTGLTFVVLAIGFLYARPDRGLMKVFTSDTTGGAVARRLLPAAILLPIALGWLRLQGQHLGFYDVYFGLALFTLSMMLAFTVIVALSARHLYRSDAGRRRVEEDLRESNILRQAILDSANYTIISTGPDGTILSFNSGAERSLGYSADEVIGKATPAIIHDPREVAARAQELSRELGKDIEPGFEAFVARARLGGPDENEWTYIRKDGSRFPVRLSVTALRDAEGEITGFLGVGSDLTERKRAEETLRENEEQFRVLVDGVRDYAILTLNPDGRVASWNAGTEHIKGYEADEVVGKHFSIFYTEEDIQSGHPEEELRIAATEGSYEEEGLRVRKDGSRFWASVLITSLKDEEGKLRGFSKITRDITERKQAEVRLRYSEEQQRAVIANLPDALVVMFDRDLRFTLVEGPAMWRVGWKKEDLQGKTIHESLPPERAGALEPLLRKTLAGERQSFEWPSTRGNRIFSVDTVPLNGDRGETGVGLLVAHDITDRRQAEEEMRKAREAAEDASRAKSEFLANMSHEIRTPMNGVIGMTDLLMHTELTERQRGYAGAVRRSGENLLAILNDLLDFSKIEAGKMRLETLEFDLRDTVEDVATVLAESAHVKGIEMAHHIEADVPRALKGDPGRLRQVLNNLIGNAVKFTEAGEIVVRVALAEDLPDTAVLRCSVTDTGIGMTEVEQRRLFRAFSQADASTTRKYGGTGLGLAISKQLVELMGGEIGVESEPGSGSTFWFTIPLGKQGRKAEDAGEIPVDLRGLRVLIVDDNATNRQILREQTSRWVAKAVSVEDGFRALEDLRSAASRGEPFDLAFLDFHMPGMDGIELARRIKADPLTGATRLALLTSVGWRGEGGEAREAGLDAYLSKPLRETELRECLLSVMGSSPTEKRQRFVTRHTLRENAFRRGRLLIAEDNPINQEVALGMLDTLGYEADVAADGTAALDALSRTPYDGVLMDCQMPVMDGYEATAEIRRREGDATHTPIIAMTANALAGDREKALTAGMDDYLPKPVSVTDLEAALERWIPAKGPESPKKGSSERSWPRLNETAAEPSVPDSAVLDSATLDKLRALRRPGKPDILARMGELFAEDVPTRLAAIEEALRKGDVRAVEHEAHTIKGSCSNLGAWHMVAVAGELLGLASSGDLREAPPLAAQLKTEFERARAALEAELKKEESPGRQQ